MKMGKVIVILRIVFRRCISHQFFLCGQAITYPVFAVAAALASACVAIIAFIIKKSCVTKKLLNIFA